MGNPCEFFVDVMWSVLWPLYSQWQLSLHLEATTDSTCYICELKHQPMGCVLTEWHIWLGFNSHTRINILASEIEYCYSVNVWNQSKLCKKYYKAWGVVEWFVQCCEYSLQFNAIFEANTYCTYSVQDNDFHWFNFSTCMDVECVTQIVYDNSLLTVHTEYNIFHVLYHSISWWCFILLCSYPTDPLCMPFSVACYVWLRFWKKRFSKEKQQFGWLRFSVIIFQSIFCWCFRELDCTVHFPASCPIKSWWQFVFKSVHLLYSCLQTLTIHVTFDFNLKGIVFIFGLLIPWVMHF